MKNITILIIMALFAAQALYAQTEQKDTTQSQQEAVKAADSTAKTSLTDEEAKLGEVVQIFYSYGKHLYTRVNREKARPKWAGIGLNFPGLTPSLLNTSLPSEHSYLQMTNATLGVVLNFGTTPIIATRKFVMFTGLGLEINTFEFKNDNSIRSENGVIVSYEDHIQRGVRVRSSTLVTTYINIPLIFQYNFSGNSGLFFNAGVLGGFRTGGRTDISGRENGSRVIIRNRGGLELTRFHYGFTSSIGYGIFALSAQYYPHSIFRTGAAPRMEQYNIGVMILF